MHYILWIPTRICPPHRGPKNTLLWSTWYRCANSNSCTAPPVANVKLKLTVPEILCIRAPSHNSLSSHSLQWIWLWKLLKQIVSKFNNSRICCHWSLITQPVVFSFIAVSRAQPELVWHERLLQRHLLPRPRGVPQEHRNVGLVVQASSERQGGTNSYSDRW